MARPQLASDEELLDVARSAFIEHGPGVSTALIAERAGVSQATLFKRFGTKDELMLAALLPPEIPRWMSLLDVGPTEADLQEQLREVMLAASVFFEEMLPCMTILRARGRGHFEDLQRYEVPPPVRGQRAVAAWLRRARAQGRIRDVNVDAVAVAFMGSMHARAFVQHLTGSRGLGGATPDYVDAIVDLIWRGIAPEDAE
ncbi:MAG: TetR/AcrR family transcriptional regulator [Alphaproteobacteria bacterium]|nr:TetR/AcrR family transcriptional regulator [Alphaproteobacteria bacterium]